MNKEEILSKSKKDNKGVDEMELYVLSTAGKIASKVGLLVCCFVAVLQAVLTHNVSFECWMIYFSILAATFIVKYIKLHRKHELLVASIYSILFLLFTVLFIINLLR
ncbi:DUF6442 family protein [Bullifex sp.]|uniref:DUF6442 family protein n=1 Tax=Bullifex sp. TaxID=2815808 RepID=UPI002A8264FD|nr:DUF6442 family protein [Bullifex sp.]MDY4066444.1 DUF6442 family protein [Bullifex sp.]